MNLLGKTFTVLILVMSITFMVISVMVYATHKDWKGEATQLQTQITEAKKINEDRKAEIEKTTQSKTKEHEMKGLNLAALQTEADALRTEEKQNKEKIAQMEESLRKKLDELKTIQAKNKELNDQRNQLQADIDGAQSDRDKNFEQVKTLTDQLHQTANDLKVLERAQCGFSRRFSENRPPRSRQSPADGESCP